MIAFLRASVKGRRRISVVIVNILALVIDEC